MSIQSRKEEARKGGEKKYMVTRIELHRVYEQQGKQARIIAESVEVGDTSGKYDTHLGKIGVTYRDVAKSIDLDVSEAQDLQGRKGRKERTIVFAGTRGIQQIGGREEIVVYRNVQSQSQQ